MRKAWLDNLRWSVVLLVLVYHVCYLFNGVGILGSIPGARAWPRETGSPPLCTRGLWCCCF